MRTPSLVANIGYGEYVDHHGFVWYPSLRPTPDMLREDKVCETCGVTFVRFFEIRVIDGVERNIGEKRCWPCRRNPVVVDPSRAEVYAKFGRQEGVDYRTPEMVRADHHFGGDDGSKKKTVKNLTDVEIGKKLREIRLAAGYTDIKEFAKLAGHTPGWVSAVETGSCHATEATLRIYAALKGRTRR